MIDISVNLECFDEAPDGSERPTAEYAKGFAAGVEQSTADIAAQRQQAVTEIAATLSDMSFGYTEARDMLLEQIQPLLAQIADTILPEIAKEGFSALLTDTLNQAFNAETERAIELTIAPDLVGELSSVNGIFEVTPDSKLVRGQAILRRKDTHVMVDLPHLIHNLQAALHGFETTQRTHSNG